MNTNYSVVAWNNQMGPVTAMAGWEVTLAVWRNMMARSVCHEYIDEPLRYYGLMYSRRCGE